VLGHPDRTAPQAVADFHMSEGRTAKQHTRHNICHTASAMRSRAPCQESCAAALLSDPPGRECSAKTLPVCVHMGESQCRCGRVRRRCGASPKGHNCDSPGGADGAGTSAALGRIACEGPTRRAGGVSPPSRPPALRASPRTGPHGRAAPSSKVVRYRHARTHAPTRPAGLSGCTHSLPRAGWSGAVWTTVVRGCAPHLQLCTTTTATGTRSAELLRM
jgi:hypothetical protein